MQYALLEEMQGWQEEEDHENILEFCANQQRFSFKLNFTPLRIENAQSASSSSLITAPEGGVLNERRCNIELEKITNVICKTEQKIFVSVNPDNFMEHLSKFINENPSSTLKTYKTKTDYYLLMSLKNQEVMDRTLMIAEIYKAWGQ